MTFILICGEQNSGKTSVCHKLRDMIELNANFTKCSYPSSAMSVEVLEHYEKGGRHVVLYSPSDDNDRIKRLATYIDDFAAAAETKDRRPDVIITTIRESGVPMSRMLALLEAIANGTQNLESHFEQHIATVTSFAPVAHQEPRVRAAFGAGYRQGCGRAGAVLGRQRGQSQIRARLRPRTA